MTAGLDKKDGVQSSKWGVITLHPWLPSKDEQIARARAWGIEEVLFRGDDISRLVIDDVSKVKRTTNWMAKLTERADFIRRLPALKGEKTVFFANPLCVGFSAKVAEQTIQGLWDANAAVYVHSVKDNGSALYVEGDDLTEFYEAVGLLANAAHQSAWRARKS